MAPQRKDHTEKTPARASLGFHTGVLILLILVGLGLRIAFSLSVKGDNAYAEWDGKEYHGYALSILHGEADNYPHVLNCIRSPGYPLFLVPFVAASANALWPIQLAQSLLGVLQVYLLAHIAAVWAGPFAGRWTFVLALFHPILIFYCALILTETLFMVLLFASVACLQEVLAGPRERTTRYVIGAGVLLGLGCLTRPALQLLLPFVALWIGWLRWREHRAGEALRQMLWFTAICALLILPWTLRNKSVYGEYTLAPGNATLLAAEGNSMEYYKMFQAQTKGEYYRLYNSLFNRINRGPDTSPERLRASATEFRTQHRAEWWKLQYYKFVHFWTPWVNPLIFTKANFYVSLVTLTPLFLGAALELYRRRRAFDPFLVLLLGIVVCGYAAGGLLFDSVMRYRIPFVDVTFMILTGSWLGNARIFGWSFASGWPRNMRAARVS